MEMEKRNGVQKPMGSTDGGQLLNTRLVVKGLLKRLLKLLMRYIYFSYGWEGFYIYNTLPSEQFQFENCYAHKLGLCFWELGEIFRKDHKYFEFK